jgi:hypothetical protein
VDSLEIVGASPMKLQTLTNKTLENNDYSFEKMDLCNYSRTHRLDA